MNRLTGKYLIVTVFAIAMALLESAVVIYLREIMYPGGFSFPLAPVLPRLAATEILRELATLVMLICVGWLAGKSFSERVAWFVFSFAVWDIFYYVFLWLLIGWPSSLLTWDVLFLVPVTWTGPVITPLILTLLMITLSSVILVSSYRGRNTRLVFVEWAGIASGSVVVIIAFVTDYLKHMLEKFTIMELLKLQDGKILEYASQYIPDRFPWGIFITGTMILLAAIVHFIIRLHRYGRYASG